MSEQYDGHLLAVLERISDALSLLALIESERRGDLTDWVARDIPYSIRRLAATILYPQERPPS